MKLWQKYFQACLVAGLLCLQGCGASNKTPVPGQEEVEAAVEDKQADTQSGKQEEPVEKQTEIEDRGSEGPAEQETIPQTETMTFNNTIDGHIQVRKEKVSWLEERRMSGPLVGWALANYFTGGDMDRDITLDTMVSWLGTTNEVGTYMVDLAEILSQYMPQDFPSDGEGQHRYESVMLETNGEVSQNSDAEFLESVHCSLNHGLPVVVIADESLLFSSGYTAFMIITGAQEVDGVPVALEYLAPSVDEEVHTINAERMISAMKTGNYFAYMRHVFLPAELYAPDIAYESQATDPYNPYSDRSSNSSDSSYSGPIVALKPVIYLYPEKETEVSVKLDLNGELECTYPAYNNGWKVTASADGTLKDAKGQTYSYLYWEADLDADYDLSKGFCIRGEDTAAFLEEKLAELGLNRKEANEFIVFWLPQMEQNEWNVISFQSQAYTDAAKLQIDPQPDTLIRIFMSWKPVQQEVKLLPQTFVTPKRKGFTVVEWGGSRLD